MNSSLKASNKIFFDAPGFFNMWVRKSEKEIESWKQLQIEKRKNIVKPLLLALGIATASSVVYAVGYRGRVRGMIFFTNSPSISGLRTLIIFTFLFLMIFSIALFNQRRYGVLTPIKDSMLCNQCKNPSAYIASQRCNCCGELEPYGHFDWVDDKH